MANMTEHRTKIANLGAEAVREISQAKDQNALATLKNSYLGKKGSLTAFYSVLKDVSAADKPALGQSINEVKVQIEESLAQRLTLLEKESAWQASSTPEIDVTAPFDINAPVRPQLLSTQGGPHPLQASAARMMEIFQEMGFTVYEARELDDDYHMFTSLNLPPGHPAREGWDTFYTEQGLIPTVHTSNMQNRIIRTTKPPVRAVVLGKCARNENVDASHGHTFEQVEGIYVDKGITIADMKGIIKSYLEAFLGQKINSIIQPSHFPFVEPGIQYLIEWKTKNGSKWLEVMGAGMIHPFVLQEAGLDPTVYSGFAWGFGLGRLALIRHEINDIRWLHSSDIRFLQQFTSLH